MKILNPEGFIVDELRSVESVCANIPFFIEGLETLNTVAKNGAQISQDVFLKVLFHAALGKGRNLLGVTMSKNRKPLHFGVVLECTPFFEDPYALVYASYSNGKSNTVTKWALTYCEQWAQEQGFKSIKAQSVRVNGAAFRLFEKVWRFKREAVVFGKSL